jgi:hypothetical protein
MGICRQRLNHKHTPTATLDFSAATTALGTSWTDVATFVIALAIGVFGAVMLAGAVIRGLTTVGRRFGILRAKV